MADEVIAETNRFFGVKRVRRQDGSRQDCVTHHACFPSRTVATLSQVTSEGRVVRATVRTLKAKLAEVLFTAVLRVFFGKSDV